MLKNGMVDEHEFDWPTDLGTSWLRTPIDDYRTMGFVVSDPAGSGCFGRDHDGHGSKYASRRVEMDDTFGARQEKVRQTTADYTVAFFRIG